MALAIVDISYRWGHSMWCLLGLSFFTSLISFKIHYVIAQITTTSLFIAASYFIVCIYHIVLICSSTHDHLVCFYLTSYSNNVANNTRILIAWLYENYILRWDTSAHGVLEPLYYQVCVIHFWHSTIQYFLSLLVVCKATRGIPWSTWESQVVTGWNSEPWPWNSSPVCSLLKFDELQKHFVLIIYFRFCLYRFFPPHQTRSWFLLTFAIYSKYFEVLKVYLGDWSSGASSVSLGQTAFDPPASCMVTKARSNFWLHIQE